VAQLNELPECGSGESRLIGGFEAVKTVRELERRDDLNGDKSVTEEWRARELNCEVIYSESRIVLPDGSAKARNVDKIIAVNLGEPKAEFFVVPTDYAEQAPSQVMEEQSRLRGNTQPCEGCARRDAILDQIHSKPPSGS
jgi:hypothetical protein